MKKHLKEYIDELDKEIDKYKEKPTTWSNLRAVAEMEEARHWLQACYERKCSCEDEYDEDAEFTEEMAHEWAKGMENEDGTMGAHWTMEQTTAVAEQMGVEFEHITPYCFWITMSMMYSDYCKTAQKHGVDRADFYADLACDFLFDVDSVSPTEKLYWYFEKIAKH